MIQCVITVWSGIGDKDVLTSFEDSVADRDDAIEQGIEALKVWNGGGVKVSFPNNELKAFTIDITELED